MAVPLSLTVFTFLQVAGANLRQTQGFVQLARCQQPSVGCDGDASELHLHAAIIGLSEEGWCFHPLGASMGITTFMREWR